VLDRTSLKLHLAAAVLAVLTSTTSALAAQGDCSQPVTNGASPTASDCLFILRTAVHSEICLPPCICAPKGSLPTTATDALICLKKAVGQEVTLDCPCLGVSTTIGSTTVTTIASTTTTTLSSPAAHIIIVNDDGNNEGFNDPSPRVPVGGNNGTTLGEQRLNVFEFAAGLWEQVLDSAVDIRVHATFDNLTCNATGAVLGSAGAANYFRDFPGAPIANTWFASALANKLAGFDGDPGADDIIAQFNSAIGTTCPFPNVWYYGFDGNPPIGELDLASVVLHELGHGLGFATIVSLGSGQKAAGSDDVFMLCLADESTGKSYPEMTDGERVAASTDSGNLVWTCPAVVAGSTFLQAGRKQSGHVRMYAPDPAQPGSSVSHWDTVLSPDQIEEPVYVGPNHDVGLMREAFEDMFWNTLP